MQVRGVQIMAIDENRLAHFTHVDIDLMRLRLPLSPGQRLQAMLDARALLVGIIRGRLRRQYPDLPEAELNLKLLEEIERAHRLKPRPQFVSRHPA
jgi:hypothetical protein